MFCVKAKKQILFPILLSMIQMLIRYCFRILLPLFQERGVSSFNRHWDSNIWKTCIWQTLTGWTLLYPGANKRQSWRYSSAYGCIKHITGTPDHIDLLLCQCSLRRRQLKFGTCSRQNLIISLLSTVWKVVWLYFKVLPVVHFCALLFCRLNR